MVFHFCKPIFCDSKKTSLHALPGPQVFQSVASATDPKKKWKERQEEDGIPETLKREKHVLRLRLCMSVVSGTQNDGG